MTRSHPTICGSRRFVGLTALLLCAAGGVGAQAPYKIDRVARLGDTIEGMKTEPVSKGGYFVIGSLNDAGQMVFTTLTASRLVLLRYADGNFTPIVAPGKGAPGGTWASLRTLRVSMNQTGKVVFAAGVTAGSRGEEVSTFVWDDQTKQATAVAAKGMSVGNDRTLLDGGVGVALINDLGEIALMAGAKQIDDLTLPGVFLRGRDGKLVPVVLPDQEMPDGDVVDYPVFAALNDRGIVSFVASMPQQDYRGYLWEQGTVTPVAVSPAEGAGDIVAIKGVWVNNKNRNLLVQAVVDGGGVLREALYLLADGKSIPVALPDQEMPGGGRLKDFQVHPNFLTYETISAANDLGEHVFTATLKDGATSLYRMNVDGTVALALKSGTPSPFGEITRIGARLTEAGPEGSGGVAINNKGQIAVSVQIDRGPDTIVVLTP